MKDENKSKEQLLIELGQLRQQITELEKSEAENKRAEEQLRESEGRYRTLVESAGDAGQGIILMQDTAEVETAIVFANQEVERLTGYTSKELKGRAWADLVHPRYQEAIRERIRRRLSGEVIKDIFEISIFSRGGAEVPIEVSGSLTEFRGKPTVVGYMRDITERKRAEEALIKSELRFRNCFDLPLIGFAITSPEKGWLEVNDRICSILGYSRDEILQKSWPELTHPDDLAADIEQFNLVLSGQIEKYSMDKRFIRKDGEIIWASISVGCVREPDGRVDYIIGLMEDITERKQLEAKILESQRMSTIAHLASGVAHEVRNPLNAILAVTEALSLELKEDSEHKIYLDHIRSQVDRLSVLMRDLLDLGKPIQFSNMKRETLSEICKAAVNSWKESTSFKTHQVRMVYPKEVSSMNVVADRSRFQQVIFNIMENAAQHSPEESEIEFSILPMGASSLRVRIADRGSGIPQESLSQIFEPFFTTRRDGIGLGLSVVKQIVESHGGNIRIYNNDPPPGCTVEISLPIAQEDRG